MAQTHIRFLRSFIRFPVSAKDRTCAGASARHLTLCLSVGGHERGKKLSEKSGVFCLSFIKTILTSTAQAAHRKTSLKQRGFFNDTLKKMEPIYIDLKNNL